MKKPKKKKKKSSLKKSSELNIKTALVKAEKYYKSKQESEILDILLPFQNKYPFEMESENRIYNRLLSFGYAHRKKLTEAEEICVKQINQDPFPLDYHFILTFVYLSLREFDSAVQQGSKFLELYKNHKSHVNNYSVTHSYASHVNNYIGAAHLEKHDFASAEKFFEDAQKTDPSNHLPYLNLINLASKKGESESAMKILEDGLKNCNQIQELRMIEESLKHNSTISACMIVKNEEELLPGCLDSIRDWVDEIIIVDTGSTDRTIEIAKSYGAKIFHQPWEGNFSKHRNYSTEQATSDWIFIIDADERIYTEDISELRQLTESNDTNIISINVYNVYGENEAVTTFLPSVRFWRQNQNLRYEGIVHNVLKLGDEHPVTRAGIRLKHLGYDLAPEKMQEKFLRTKGLLEEQLKENPNNTFALYNYAQILKSEGSSYPIKNIPLILESAKHAVELTDPTKQDERYIHLMCLDQIAWAYYSEEKYDLAIEFAEKAIKLKPNYLDPLILLGNVYFKKQLWEKAIDAYNKYLKIQAEYNESIEKDNIILSHNDSRANVYYSLGLIAEMEKELKKAKTLYHKSIDLNPGLLNLNLQLAQIYLKENDLQNAKKYFEKQLSVSNDSQTAALGLAEIYRVEKDYSRALEQYKIALKLDNNNLNVQFKYGKFLLEQGSAAQALKAFENIYKENKLNQELNKLLADTYFNLNRFDKAIDIYKQSLLGFGKSAEILNDLGNCYFKLEQFEEAADFYKKSIKESEPIIVSFRNLGLAYLRLGKYKEAIPVFEKYCQIKQEDYDFVNILGDIYLKTGDNKSALNSFEYILRSDPTNKQALFSLSECYLVMGHRDSALAGYKRLIELYPDLKTANDRISQLQEPVYNV